MKTEYVLCMDDRNEGLGLANKVKLQSVGFSSFPTDC